ncbi:hypothetical protein Lalb_Chr11g0062071 [Lupinus albus]|uniref:Uncharacterized protein n=1 Tax=Lupinus albus TaxID=3870 RepID=A0A6A4PPP0_LUPAL|nr:hypothetical protein Lalb_Chr11g0062071 [Lupinus albus]
MLCEECDLPIHSANHHAKKHHGFLLTGTKLSVTATSYSLSMSPLPSNSNNSSCCNKVSHDPHWVTNE